MITKYDSKPENRSLPRGDGAADTVSPFKIHLLDVGQGKYGDCVLCQFGEVSVLLDGSHSGDEDLIMGQLRNLLEPEDSQVRVSLLIVTHPHDDHIGCLPDLVNDRQLVADWALVADPKYRWGDRDQSDAFFAGNIRARALVGAIQEEERADLPDEELAQFIDSVGGLESRYRAFIEKMTAQGTRVVRHATDADAEAELTSAFSNIGLEIIGPTLEHLEECARLLQRSNHDTQDFINDSSAVDASMNAVNIYRNLLVGQADTVSANKGAINLQSIVTRFEYNGHRIILGGDMQFSDPEVSSDMLKENVIAMRQEIRSKAPYSFAKLSHHGSYNGINEAMLREIDSKLYGICCGIEGASHPHPRVLQLLNDNRAHLDWVRTDRNGQVTITLDTTDPQIELSRGEISDPTPKRAEHRDFNDMIDAFVDIDSPVLSEASAPIPSGQWSLTIPAHATRVSLVIDLQPMISSLTQERQSKVTVDVTDAMDFDGVASSQADAPSLLSSLTTEFNRASANGWVPFFITAGSNFNWPVELLMAIASRESNIRSILGDGGHGHGIMQIDDRSFPEFTNSSRWRDPRLNILKGAEVLSGKRRFLSGRGVQSPALLRASVAAYNSGEGNVWRAIQRGLDVDTFTTQRNYSADVLRRAAIFRDLLP